MKPSLTKPIFVFGCCNSGTTILWQALKNHKDLCGPDVEGQDLEDLPDSMRHYLGKCTFRLWAHSKFKMCYYRNESDYSDEERQQIEEVYLRYCQSSKRFITKSPPDSMRARLLQAYFPDAYFVGIVRDGYAVSEGIVRKSKDDPDRPQFTGLFRSIDEAAEQWFRANIILVSNKDYLRNYKIIKYEDIVSSPEAVLNSVLDFCGLDKPGFPMPSFDKGLNDKQIARLNEYDLETITRIAQPMLLHFGYELRNAQLRW